MLPAYIDSKAYLSSVSPLGAPLNTENYSRLIKKMERDISEAPPQYDEHVLEAASLWHFLYHEWPTSEKFDFLEHE